MNSKELLNRALELYNSLPWWDKADLEEIQLWLASDEQLKEFIEEIERR